MIRKLLIFALILNFTACAELQQIANDFPESGVVTAADLGNGLREALDFGIDKQVSKLTLKDGFYKNDLVKIMLPEELKKVDKALRDIGLSSLADDGIKALNRAATFDDAKNILLGNNDAATQYLTGKTQTALYSKFNPVIKNSFGKVGADQIWANLINKYNALPFTNNVNPDLSDYVTGEALKGVYTMIAVEEKEIRTKIESRTTNLLQRVFKLQD